MASSLEELLAEEGFKRRSMNRSSSSSNAVGARMSFYTFRDSVKSDLTLDHRSRTVSARSDVARYSSRRESSSSEDVRDPRPRDNPVRKEKNDEKLTKETRERLFRDINKGKGISANLSKDMPRNEIDEVGKHNTERFRDIYSNKMYRSEVGKDKHSIGAREKEVHKERLGMQTKVDKRHDYNLRIQLLGHMSLIANKKKSIKKPTTSYNRSNRGSENTKSFKDNHVQLISEPAIDEVAIQAIVSILNGYIKRFLNDEDFRTMLRHNCFSSLINFELEQGQSTESKVMACLEKAIETVEKAAEDSSSAKDLKKASFQLSEITGLNSNNLKDGFTSEIPTAKLSACAHLYLSVIYKLQKKDRFSAQHLLQVFCSSPFQARTILLPELWDYLFLPHLSHLKDWYNKEADSLADALRRTRKLKLLEKVYNEILDSGTYQFAVYYKDWLTEGVEAPSVPSIDIPSASLWGARQGSSFSHSSELSSSRGPFSPQPMVSKRLYDAVFSSSTKAGVNEAEDSGEAENIDDCTRSIGDSDLVKETLTYSSEAVKYSDHDLEEDSYKSVLDDAFLSETELSSAADEGWMLHGLSASPKSNLDDEFGDSTIWQQTTGNIKMPHAEAHTKDIDELTLKSLAKSIFELQQSECSVDLCASSLSNSSEASTSCSVVNPIRTSSSLQGELKELQESHEYFDELSFFSSIPQDFICPLTGQLFEDPVTLQTGQTFERVAAKAWFDKGNRTCPVTGTTLEYVAVPLTNFVLKRVIDNWRLEYCRHLLDFSSQAMENSGEHGLKHLDETVIVILEQLLTAFSEEGKRTNAKHLISLGGLHFLLQRFELGKMEEKAHAVALLSYCIEADASCRNRIARNINKRCLLELLQSKQVKMITNAVSLLTELVCLERRKDANLFVSGLLNEGIVNTLHILLFYLQSSPKEHRPLVAVLLLHLDLLAEPQKQSIYREEAIDAIVMALEDSLVNKKVREKCCRALHILGGRFSFSGKLLTESWILKQTGFEDSCEVNSLENEDENLLVDDTISWDDEEQENEEWLRNLSVALLSNGKKSLLDTISKCLASGNLDMVRVCLTTMAWLSCALPSLPDAEFQLSAFSSLISGLKESLEKGEKIEHKILASMCLLNFSKISECRVLLMTIADEIAAPLRSLAEVTWTAKQLYANISGEDL
ncbi:hypothetical protein ACB094_08G136400 [Castanea mollissima]